MSRSHYSDDFGEDYAGQLELYRANVDRSFRSKAGRAKLTELLAALDAMPVKELADNVFIESRPADEARPGAPMCALGAWAATALGDDKARGLFREAEPDSITTADVLTTLGWPKLVVFDVIHENDDPERCTVWRVAGPRTREEAERARWHGQPHGPVIYRLPETDAERWQRVRAWVANKLAEIAARDARIAAWTAAHPYTTPSPAGVGLL